MRAGIVVDGKGQSRIWGDRIVIDWKEEAEKTYGFRVDVLRRGRGSWILETDLGLRLFEEIKESGDCVSLKQLAVNGGDLLAKGLVKGKQIGDGLMYLLNLVLEKPELNKKDILLEKINQFKEK